MLEQSFLGFSDAAYDAAAKEIADLLEAEIECERDEATDSKLWDFECEQLEDLLWKSRTTGTPDMFSEELRSFWDNGRPGNV